MTISQRSSQGAANGTGPQTTAGPGRRRADVLGDHAIALALLVIFAGAFVIALRWPFGAALFPLMVSGAGAVLAAVRLVTTLVRGHDATPTVPDRQPAADGDQPAADGDEDEVVELEYAFAGAGTRRWLTAAAWLAGFFTGVWTFGLIATCAVFTPMFLKLEARTSVVVAVVYTAAVVGILRAMQLLVHVQLPDGLLFT